MLYLFNQNVEQRIEDSLAGELQLATTQMSQALARYSTHAELLAGNPAASFLVAHESVARQLDPNRHLSDTAEQLEPARFNELVETLLATALAHRSEVVQLALLDSSAERIVASSDFTWEPIDGTLIAESMATASTRFGDAFREQRLGERRLGIVTPINAPTGEVVGALLLEARLGPIVDAITLHTDRAETSDAHIVQRTPHGDALFITPLRFDQDAAFNRTVSYSAEQPANISLASPEARVLKQKDYRGVNSIVAVRTQPETGWGVIIKIDAVEALAPVRDLRNAAVLTTTTTVLGILVAWLILLNPMGIRLKTTAIAAERIAQGHLDTFIGDRKRDEIGEVARTIDRLAKELKADKHQRTSVEAQLRHQATHDELTGLYNRKHAGALIETLSETSNVPASIVFMDLDGFKAINDQHGHSAGDEILIELASRLNTSLGPHATAARWGGDEFIAILPGTDSTSAAATVESIRAIFERPFSTPAGPLLMGCSLGLSTSSKEQSLSAALGLADQEMYAEKFLRRSETPSEALAARTLNSALEQNRVELWLQPVTSVPEPGKVRLTGAEALVRLRSHEGGVIAPDEFLSCIHAAPIGRRLDKFMLERAVRSLSSWRFTGLVGSDFRLAVNVTGASLRDPEFAPDVAATLKRYKVPAKNIIIEISENTGDIEMQALENLRATEVRIALDDVGLLYNNLDRLVAIAPDVAKLDRQWMNDDVVLPRLIDLCQSLGLELVAEGVETLEQLERLQALKVVHFQGFWFDEPLPAVQFIQRWGRLDGSRDTTTKTRDTRTVAI